MRRMVEGSYIIVKSKHRDTLQDIVNDKTREGYEIVGGVAVVFGSNSWWFYQSICKYETIEDNRII